MEILEYKNQNIIIKEGEEKEFLIPVFETPHPSPLLKGEGTTSVQIDFEINANASVKVFVIGVLSEDAVRLQLNSTNLGENSSFDAKVGFVQFGNSAVDFSGLMRIKKGAKGSSASLHVESLLLSPLAKATLIPSLEILENEVSAGHGAIVRSIDPEQIFYLRTRGIPLDIANGLLIEGFLDSFGVELPGCISDEFNLIIDNELSRRHCALDCEWCEK